MANEANKSGDATACSPGDLSTKKDLETTFENTKLNTVPLNWKEVCYTNCPPVSASNVDQELGWTREEYKKIGVKYGFLRSVRENDWYPHYIHNLDNLIRIGGLFPPIHVHADIRRTRLLGVTHAPHEGGCMMVRARDDVYRMVELKGKKFGLSKKLASRSSDQVPEKKQTSLGLYVVAQVAHILWKANPERVKILDVRMPEEADEIWMEELRIAQDLRSQFRSAVDFSADLTRSTYAETCQ
jgi:hypothetical protein